MVFTAPDIIYLSAIASGAVVSIDLSSVVIKMVPIMFGAIIAAIGYATKRFMERTDVVESTILKRMDKMDASLSAHRIESERRITRMETSIEHVEERLEAIEEQLRR